MASPDFSEFTFGYAVTRHIEDTLGGRIAVPSFPTTVQEADLGYDVDFLSHGVPLVFQYKRSSVMKRSDCKEFGSPHFSHIFHSRRPFYRMHLHKNHQYNQHLMLRVFEYFLGGGVWYCTSSVQDKAELDGHYRRHQMFDASTFFRPSSIALPDLHEDHFVSFHPSLPVAYLFSEQGLPFYSGDVSPSNLDNRGDASAAELLERTSNLFENLDSTGPAELARRERASIHKRFSETTESAREIVQQWTDGVARDVVFPSASEDLLDAPDSPVAQFPRFPPRKKGESLIKRLAYEVSLHADAMLISVPRERLK
ncbi:hypothetical protein G6L29_10625 [Agrobacterium rhizogenes]|uniref:hypothetical protein n=1 Tax=Rhizobium rhizogenes TaxID=359 RepID=UPI0015726CE4|nr:hypothetical protein [Rhizobium rhizogenes]NTI16090.1 hypothetical protein [Rhizobium rhizogenes]